MLRRHEVPLHKSVLPIKGICAVCSTHSGYAMHSPEQKLSELAVAGITWHCQAALSCSINTVINFSTKYFLTAVAHPLPLDTKLKSAPDAAHQ